MQGCQEDSKINSKIGDHTMPDKSECKQNWKPVRLWWNHGEARWDREIGQSHATAILNMATFRMGLCNPMPCTRILMFSALKLRHSLSLKPVFRLSLSLSQTSPILNLSLGAAFSFSQTACSSVSTSWLAGMLNPWDYAFFSFILVVLTYLQNIVLKVSGGFLANNGLVNPLFISFSKMSNLLNIKNFIGFDQSYTEPNYPVVILL